nr:methyl-CpG-binding domain-containing protein 4-like [Tanacetum cinerariifolium]
MLNGETEADNGCKNKVLVVLDSNMESKYAHHWALDDIVQNQDTMILLHIAIGSIPDQYKKSRGPPHSSVDTFDVQCNDCFKWRTIPTKEEFKEYRSKQNKDPFACSKLEGIVYDSPADIEYDSSRTWVMDKPNIPKTPKGFQRIIVLRRDYSKMDV